MKINIKKLMLTSMTFAMLLAQPLAAEVCKNLDWNDAASLRQCQEEMASYGPDVYETNEEYCESIDWEDEYNCVVPGQKVTEKFCESIPFEDTQEVCFRALKKQSNE